MLYSEFRSLVEQLIREVTCPSCKSKHTEADMTILGSFKDEIYLHIKCPKCNTQSLVNAAINRYRELRKHQGLKIRNLGEKVGPITRNEVVEIHNFLENFDGDFKKLFSQQK